MKTVASVNIHREADVAVVSFTSHCVSDVGQITDASSRVNRYVQEDPPREIIFDFSGVKFFSSQVLGLLLEARCHVKQHGGQVAVCGLDPQLHRVFRITNLDRIFTFYPDRPTALASTTAGDR